LGFSHGSVSERLPLPIRSSSAVSTSSQKLRDQQPRGRDFQTASPADAAWSEDMQHGMVLEGRLHIANPFRAVS
jgi:hypothetical protein